MQRLLIFKPTLQKQQQLQDYSIHHEKSYKHQHHNIKNQQLYNVHNHHLEQQKPDEYEPTNDEDDGDGDEDVQENQQFVQEQEMMELSNNHVHHQHFYEQQQQQQHHHHHHEQHLNHESYTKTKFQQPATNTNDLLITELHPQIPQDEQPSTTIRRNCWFIE